MALNIDLDGFGFLDSDSEMSSKLSPTLKQPPISPIESESSSGISSLDSDDLKKQLLSSPPTISISHDQDDDDVDQQSNDGGAISTEKDEEKEGESEMDSEEEERQSDSAQDEQSEMEDVTVAEIIEVVQVTLPVQVNYQNRNVLNLAGNVWDPGHFIQYTVLPENNLSCFFQNRAQYWRLGNSSGSEKLDALEKCSCCDFSYPSIYQQQPNNQHGLSMAKNNAITDSLLTFLKNHHADYNNAMPNNNNINTNINNNNLNNNNNNINKRMYNNNNNSNNAPYATYQHIQQQYQQQKNNGYYNNSMNGFNQQMNTFNNNGNNVNGGYNNGTSALALLNLMNMNQTRSVAAGAFHQAMNNNSRYYNNNTNNGYGLYKQF